jgi:aminoglycoside phosphotransferase (APT) family kinase protein
MDMTDKAEAIRQGEELDAEKLGSFLKAFDPELTGKLEITQFPRGYSNLTYLLTIGDTELVLRRPPIGTKAKTAHDMSREFRMLSALRPVFPYCPKPILYSEDLSVMGSSFYVMERIKGIILRREQPSGIKFTPQQIDELCRKLVDVHVELHSIDYRAVGLMDYTKPEGYVQRQVEGWSRRYRAARTPDAPDCETVMQWLAASLPPDTTKPTVVHNDFRFDNAVLDENDPMKIIGVLDWEMATVGDPLMDLGNSLAYWVQNDDPPEMQLMRLTPVDLQGLFTRKEIVRYYGEKSGRAVDDMHYYYCFGLFRLAVIAQQIYYRYYHGQTKDERFKMLVLAVQVLDQAANRVIQTSQV